MHCYYVLTPGARFCHWAIAACMAVLFPTGLYIGSPGYIGTQGIEPAVAVGHWFSMETIRYVHFTAGFLLIACLLLRAYLLFTYRGNRLFPKVFSKTYWLGIVDMVTYYTFLRKKHQVYVRSPLAASAYMMTYVLLAVEAASGLAMYAMVKPNSLLATLFNPVNHLLGNEYMTHIVHHYIAWIFVLFVLGHVYLVFYTDITDKDGELSSVVSGQKHFADVPVDLPSGLMECQESNMSAAGKQ